MSRTLILVLALLCLGASPPVRAQLPLPNLPGVGEVLPDLPDARELARQPLEELREVRRLRVRELLRNNRGELEAGPRGEPIVRSQILAIGASEGALDAASQAGFEIVRRDDLGELGAMITLRAPHGMSTRTALRRLREADSAGTYDFDHLHIESGPAGRTSIPKQNARDGPRIGLIDGGVAAHEAFHGAVAAQRGFAADQAVPSAHGAAVASLIVAAAPRARLYVADIYCGAPTGGASSALARALAWLAQEGVPVINVSLVGPRNRVVETIVAQLTARGFVIVAAVGNDGPAAAPLFPAAYPGVVGVTGVDARERVLIEAGRGAQVDFAALGVTRAAAPDGYANVRGTSYAAPLVSALLASRMTAPSPQQASAALTALRTGARDLGARGRDDIYGDGLVVGTAAAAPAR